MILKEFLENPVGKGDASVNASLITESLNLKYEASYSDDKKKIEVKVFHQPLKDIYWIWLIIPSETGRGNTYDVVYKFINPDPKNRLGVSISKFNIEVFANSPSFAYTYAYVYNKNGLLIPELNSKLGRAFMGKSPDTRNRNQIILFDKYVYFGAKYILDSKLLNRAIADVKAKKYDERYLVMNIRSLSKIMDEYDIAEQKVRKKKLVEKKKGGNKGKDDRNSSSSMGVKLVPKKSSISSVTKNAAKKKSTIQKTRSTIKKK